jgi:phage terminase large subunit
MNALALNRESAIAPFDARRAPWQLPVLMDKSPVLVLDGSTGSGKSRVAAEKLHAFCLKYPKATTIALRKTYESMKNSTLLFLQSEVIGNDPRVRFLKQDHRFEYSNGSVIVVGGMADERQRLQIRSVGITGGVDMVWIEEATALAEEDFNEFPARMRGRAAGWRQIMLTTNPGARKHWINRKLIMGGLKGVVRYQSSTWDNTLNDEEYRESLKLITGVQKLRLVDGLWADNEGAIYDNWSDRNVNGDIAMFDPNLPIIWGVDDGYKHPRVILMAQIKPDGTVCVVGEYCKSLQLFDQTLRDATGMFGIPSVAIVDPAAASFAAFLNDNGIQTVNADNSVAEGIKTVREYICDGNDVVSFYVHPDCVKTIECIEGYQWSESTALLGGDPKPLKENDDPADAARYLLHTKHGMSIPRGGYSGYS